ncbi:hypothetical protein V5E97_09685 [Singulisphaera sp. Ch08]|uniref:Rad50/SbcC-type AAA domain-containing protein n=1 Tax=Singulisphaera sp. Ch08 TaxID=3120278 RepID=A0AAU7CMZ6_9BACT
MKRITLAMLEVTNGSLPPAILDFQAGLNVLSGKENRGKSYAFSCLDFLFGAKAPPESNRHSTGYERATLYFSTSDRKRGVMRREFKDGGAEMLPYHPLDSDVPGDGWKKLTKGHSSKRESLAGYWLDAMGITPTSLRGNASGSLKALTIRYIAHLILIDELRIMDKRSPAKSSQVVAWPADIDALAYVMNARLNPPEVAVAVVQAISMPPGVREWIITEIARIDVQIEESATESNPGDDELTLVSRRAEEFAAASDSAASELREVLVKITDAQTSLTAARSQQTASREVLERLKLLREYYESDLRRLAAVNETAFLLEQLNQVPCPTCFHPFDAESLAASDVAKDYLRDIQRGTKAEAKKIARIQADLDETLASARQGNEQARGSERFWSDVLEFMRSMAEGQSKRVAQAHAEVTKTFSELGRLAQRKSLKDRRNELLAQLGEMPAEEVEVPADREDGKTQFDQAAVDDFCGIVAAILEAWKWNYTPRPIAVELDLSTLELKVSGSARSSFGKAARALLSSAFLIGLMDYCLGKDLPHPGFVVLDSPLTTKQDSRVASDADEVGAEVSDDVLNAFFEHLALNYSDRQVIIIDNKEPPQHLMPRINHIRFGDDRLATRAGFFG